MATLTILPTTVTSTAAGFQPAFKHVGTSDRHADALACIAIVASSTMREVFEQAETLGMPKTGQYNHWLGADFLAKVLASNNWVASGWKECSNVANLPDLCIALVEYDTEWEVGRYVVIHKAKGSHDAKMVTYAIDPAARSAEQQVRTDLDVLAPAWYLALHPMGKSVVTPAKK